MNDTSCHPDPLFSELKQLVAARFRRDLIDPERIPDDEPLIRGALGLDSLDALELAQCVEEKYDLPILHQADLYQAFGSIRSLAGFIRANHEAKLVRAPAPAISLEPAN